MIKKKSSKKKPVVIAKAPVEESVNDTSDVKSAPIGLEFDDVCHCEVIEELMDHEKRIFEKISSKTRDNGFVVINNNGHGHIAEPYNDYWAAAFIPGVALGSSEMKDDFAACTILNTLNHGFVYASVNDNNEVEAIGPVVTPCIIGNHSKPYGIYIPMNNRQAIISGINVALDFLDRVDNIHIDELPESSYKETEKECNNSKLNW